MKQRYILVILYCIFAVDFYANQNQSSGGESINSPLPYVVEIYNEPIFKIRNANDCHQKSHSESNPIINVNSDMSKMLSDALHDQGTACKGFVVDCFTWVNNNKIQSACITLLAIYSFVACQTYRLNRIIHDESSWMNWKSCKSIDDFLAISQKELERELVHAIQARYVHPVNPTDFIYSMVQFSTAIENEIEVMEQQIMLYQLIETSCTSKIFFIDATDLAKLQDKFRKLNFIKHIFISWCADYKIEQSFRITSH